MNGRRKKKMFAFLWVTNIMVGVDSTIMCLAYPPFLAALFVEVFKVEEGMANIWKTKEKIREIFGIILDNGVCI